MVILVPAILAVRLFIVVLVVARFSVRPIVPRIIVVIESFPIPVVALISVVVVISVARILSEIVAASAVEPS
jgi:hypothetical protein